MDYVSKLRRKIGTNPINLNGSIVFILNDENELLVQQRLDGTWGFPGGLMELGESYEETAIREVKEETGLRVEELEFFSVCSGEEYFVSLDNGDQYYAITALFTTSKVSGKMIIDYSESKTMNYFPLDSLPRNMNHRWKQFLTKFLEYYEQ